MSETIVMGIESSCDETACALVNDKKEILSSVVWSQYDEHRRFGGVVPEIAARAHLEKCDVLINEALTQAGKTFSDLSAVAVAAGPGLIGGVLVGVMTAKAIAYCHHLPFIAVNHLEGHALTARLSNPVQFPYLLLLTSGGHCQILIVEGVGKYKKLGATIDDSAGEAFDKVAK
ncbi:MAG: tRNA (adenosine(37)-N6)-threonylcarbamoyltransferase complex transferase subunit TsaD, partial [Alphaproteobacteria bacterium]